MFLFIHILESELVSGFLTEHSSAIFVFFFLEELVNCFCTKYVDVFFSFLVMKFSLIPLVSVAQAKYICLARDNYPNKSIKMTDYEFYQWFVGFTDGEVVFQ